MTDHRESQRTHARAAARHRYGLDLADSDLEAICDLIRSGSDGARRVVEADFGRQGWMVRWRGRRLATIYDPETDMVATFLPSLEPLKKRRPATSRTEQAAREFGTSIEATE